MTSKLNSCLNDRRGTVDAPQLLVDLQSKVLGLFLPHLAQRHFQAGVFHDLQAGFMNSLYFLAGDQIMASLPTDWPDHLRPPILDTQVVRDVSIVEPIIRDDPV